MLLSKNRTQTNKTGFTIVELLIVVVVIAILAAITIVAYNGIQNRAKQSATRSALSQANKKILTYAVDNADQYPPDLATAGVTNGAASFQYSVNNDSTPRTYGLTATSSNVSYFISNTSTSPTAGAYIGHGSGGVATITNLVLNPNFESNITYWTNAGTGPTTLTRVNTQFHSGAYSMQGVSDGSYSTQGAFTNGRSTINPNTTYTASIWIKGEAGKTIRLEFGELTSGGALVGSRTASPNVTATGNWQQLSVSRAVGSTAALADIVVRNVNAVTHTFYLDDAMITEGDTLYNYADGNSNQWVWNGTANASTSTGMPI